MHGKIAVGLLALSLASLTLAAGVSAAPDAGASRKESARTSSPAIKEAQGPLAPARSTPGCRAPRKGATGAFEAHTIRVGDSERSYQLLVPKSYRASRPYPVIFRFHGRGGNGLSGGLGIEAHSGEQAIVVAPDGLDQNFSWASEERDLALFDALLKLLADSYCIDEGRVYAYGFSAGARFSQLLACKRAERLAAIAAIAGFDETPRAACGRAVAAWLMHDVDDPTYASLARGIVARDRLRAQSGCSEGGTVEGECLRYRGCAARAPVVWCQTQGRGHDIRGEDAPAQVWKFFSSLSGG